MASSGFRRHSLSLSSNAEFLLCSIRKGPTGVRIQSSDALMCCGRMTASARADWWAMSLYINVKHHIITIRVKA